MTEARFSIAIAGEYGAQDGSIHLLVDGTEVVMWDSAEWAEDPSLVYVIAEAIRRGHRDPESLRDHLSHAPDPAADTEADNAVRTR